MARHILPAISSDHQLTVGYDATTRMYFAQVYRSWIEKDVYDKLVFESETPTLERLAFKCKSYGAIPHETQETLRQERSVKEYLPGATATTTKLQSSSFKTDRNLSVKRNFHLVDTPDTTVYFDDMKEHFLDCIRSHDAAFCAVYSLTDQPIIDALADLERVSVLVDERQKSQYCNYSRLEKHEGIPAYGSDCIEVYSSGSDYTHVRYDPLEALTFVTPTQQEKDSTGHESFHTKFCVFASVEKHKSSSEDSWTEHIIIPRAIWVGSYNPTPTGNRSIQSAVLLRSRLVVLAFMSEYFALYRAQNFSVEDKAFNAMNFEIEDDPST